MKASLCHYSFHRTWTAEKWDAYRFAAEAKKTGVVAFDFHARLLGSPRGAAETIRTALDKTGLELSALSLSNNFGHEDLELVSKEIEETVAWMRIAKLVRAPVSRIFGSPLPSGFAVHARGDKTAEKGRAQLRERVFVALQQVTREAEKLDLVLALENHHGYPTTAEEQVDLIERINSKCFRATVDVGNYMSADQAPEVGTAIAAPYAAYVHVKDYRKAPNPSFPSGWELVPCVVGNGEVDHATCLRILKDAGFDGFVAIEYEAPDDERVGIAQSVEYLKRLCHNSASKECR